MMRINPQLQQAVRYAAKHPEERLRDIAMRFELRADPERGQRMLGYYTRKAGQNRPRGAGAPSFDRSVLRGPRPQAHKFDHEEAVRMFRLGMTGREIARRMGVSQPAISKVLIAAGLRSVIQHDDQQTMKFLLSTPSLTRKQQAEKLGYSMQGLEKALSRISRRWGQKVMR